MCPLRTSRPPRKGALASPMSWRVRWPWHSTRRATRTGSARTRATRAPSGTRVPGTTASSALGSCLGSFSGTGAAWHAADMASRKACSAPKTEPVSAAGSTVACVRSGSRKLCAATSAWTTSGGARARRMAREIGTHKLRSSDGGLSTVAQSTAVKNAAISDAAEYGQGGASVAAASPRAARSQASSLRDRDRSRRSRMPPRLCLPPRELPLCSVLPPPRQRNNSASCWTRPFWAARFAICTASLLSFFARARCCFCLNLTCSSSYASVALAISPKN